MEPSMFDVYKLVLDDTNQLNMRKQSLDTLYSAVITLVLSAQIYLAAVSNFNNWITVFAGMCIGFFGSLVIRNWRRGMKELDQILRGRYSFLRKLEEDVVLLKAGATFITEEYETIYKKREKENYKTSTRHLQNAFTVAFVTVPLILFVITLLNTGPFVPAWIHQYIRPII